MANPLSGLKKKLKDTWNSYVPYTGQVVQGIGKDIVNLNNRVSGSANRAFNQTFVPWSKDFQQRNQQFTNYSRTLPEASLGGRTTQFLEGVRTSVPGMSLAFRDQAANDPTTMGGKLSRIGGALAPALITGGTLGSKSFGQNVVRSLPEIGISGAIGGGLNKLMGGDLLTGVSQGIGVYSTTKPIGALTNPLISRFAGNVAGKFNNPVTQSVAGRLGAGIGNIPEGMIMSSALGRPYSPTDALMDVGVGTLTGGQNVPLKNNLSKQRYEYIKTKIPKLDEVLRQADREDRRIMEGFLDVIRTGKFEGKTASPETKKEIFRRAQYILDGMGISEVNNRTAAKSFELFFEADKTYAGPRNVMNFAQSKPQGILKNQANKPMMSMGDLYKNMDNLPGSDVIKRTNLQGEQLSKTNEELLRSQKLKIGEGEVKKPLKQSVKDTWNEFYANFVNRFQPIENIVNQAEKQGKMKIIPEQNPVYAIKRYLGAGGSAEFRHKKELQPIIDQLGDVDKSDFDLFLKAKRDIELGKREVYGSNADEGRGILMALTEKYGDQIKNFDDTANKLYAYQDQGLQKLRDAGFIDEMTYQKIKDANKNYVPFQRVMDELDNYLGVPSKSAQQSSQPISKIKGSDRNIYSPLESIIANTYKTEVAVAKNRVTSTLVNLRKLGGDYAKMFTPSSKGGADTIAVWENGKKNYYQVDPSISKAIKGLDEEASNIVVEILAAPARLLRQQATGRNIEFMIPNVVRDQFDAAMNSKYGYVPFVDYFSGLREMIKARTGNSEIYDQWMKSGGKIFFENMSGRKAIKEQLEDATKNKNMVKKLGDWVIGGIDTIGKYSEEPTRLGLFKKAYQKTGNPLIGAMEAREGTLDFARMGSKMKVANSIIPFLNVGVQGFDRMVRTIKDNPKKATMLLATYGGLPALTTALYNNVYHQEDYAQVPDFVKENNFVIMTGQKDNDGNPVYLSFPKGHIQQLAANPTEAVINYAFQTNPQSISQFALSFLSGQLPLVGQGDNLGSIATQTVGGLIPQIVKPAVETTANYSFFKEAPIVPNYMQNRPAELQTKKTTPEVYNRLGTLLGVSPLKVQNTLEGYLAGGIKQPLNITKTLDAVSRGETPNPNDLFVLRRLVGSYSGFDNERPMATGTEPSFMERVGMAIKSSGTDASNKTITAQSTERLVNDVWRGRAKSGFSTDAYVYKDPEQDKPKQLDLSKFNKKPTGPIEKARLDNDRYSEALKVLRNDVIPEQDKTELYKRMGVKGEDIAYYDIASDTEEIRRIAVDQVIAGSNDQNIIKDLSMLRDSVNGKMILTNGLVDDLYKEGIINKTERDYLKDVGSKVTAKKSGSSKSKAKLQFEPLKVQPFKQSQPMNLGLEFKPIAKPQMRVDTSGAKRLQKITAGL